ncbi:MAG: hypothetical protein ACOYOP_12120 [Microthrixaceae bacterium]
MTAPLRRRRTALVVALGLLLGTTLFAGVAGASTRQTDPSPTTPATTAPATAPAPGGPTGGTPSTLPPLRTPTTLAQDPFAENCPPGQIVRGPNCGREPQSKDDPGGWLQVSLFFLVCAVIIGIGAFVWWRARAARAERKAAGLDPVDVARRRGEGVRPTEKVPPSRE